MRKYIETDKVATPVLRSVPLLDQLREHIRYPHYSLQTEKVYLYLVKGIKGARLEYFQRGACREDIYLIP